MIDIRGDGLEKELLSISFFCCESCLVSEDIGVVEEMSSSLQESFSVSWGCVSEELASDGMAVCCRGEDLGSDGMFV